jgi:hypothetical protein
MTERLVSLPSDRIGSTVASACSARSVHFWYYNVTRACVCVCVCVCVCMCILKNAIELMQKLPYKGRAEVTRNVGQKSRRNGCFLIFITIKTSWNTND